MAKQSKEKSQNKLCKHSCRHPKGWGMGEPPMQNGPCVGGKIPKMGCASTAPGILYAPPGRPVDRGWMRAAQTKRAPWGVKKPQNGLCKCSTRQHQMPPGQARG
ncbi:hypothetical protein B0H14DRAFT_2603532 [Mycena olivaceomarginata]|nr:hypothetical protein B0H14DRAFT_2603532 [Mycena olivaceomarginata]